MEVFFLLILIVVVLIAVVRIGAYLRVSQYDAEQAGSPAVKGARGERSVNSVLARKLPAEEYTVFHDVTLPSSHGPTQIDHIVVSRYGIFVIETKNYTGWIFGDAKSKQWTQVVFREKNQFMNPLRQNYKHTKATESFFSLGSKYIHSVVVFVGDAEFKTRVPENVTCRRGLCPYIRSRQAILLSTDHVKDLARKLSAFKEGTLAEEPSVSVVRREPNCPKCGEPMVRRTAKRGKNAGAEFWGCPKFPKCRGVRQVVPDIGSARA